jgi:hypothetical protein
VLLIFGISARDHVLATVSYVCERCGYQGAHHVIKRVRRFSIFFIPLIPLGTRHLDLCTVCGRSRELSRAEAGTAVAALR